MTLRAITFDGKDAPKIPFKEESVQEYLRPTMMVQCDDEQIAARVKEIVKDEKDSFKIARALTEWVFKNLKKEGTGTATKSAKETLMEKSGDCTEHSVLLCAMARAAGIPARQIGGLGFTGSQFGYHAWNELYLGKWIPADATCNRVGTPAGYIKLGENEAGEKEMTQTLTGITKLFGNISIEVLAAKDMDNKPIDLSGKKK